MFKIKELVGKVLLFFTRVQYPSKLILVFPYPHPLVWSKHLNLNTVGFITSFTYWSLSYFTTNPNYNKPTPSFGLFPAPADSVCFKILQSNFIPHRWLSNV